MELKSFLAFLCAAILASASSIGSSINCDALTTYKQHAAEKSLELHNLDAAIVQAIDAGEPLPDHILAPYREIDHDARHAGRQKAYDALQQLQDAFYMADTTEYGEHGQESLEQVEIQLHSLYGELEHQSSHDEGDIKLPSFPSDNTVDLDRFLRVVRAMHEFVDCVDELMAVLVDERCSVESLKPRGLALVGGLLSTLDGTVVTVVDTL